MDSRTLGEVMEQYRELREENEREDARRLREVTARCPEIAALMKLRRDTVMAGVISAFSLPPAPDLPQRVAEWNSQIKQLLLLNGFPEDYLSPVYRCALCRDTGWIGESKKTLCSCVQSRYVRLLEKNGRFEDAQTFGSYEETIYPEALLPGSDISQRMYMQAIRNRCERYADRLPHPETPNLLFSGKSGLGKTFLLRAIHARAEEIGVPALCLTANSFLRIAREAYFGREQPQMDVLYTVPLLLLDDLGTEPMLENITVEQFFNLLNERQNTHLCTVLSTNLSLKEMEARYTERIYSRLQDSRYWQVLLFRGSDVRLRR